MANRPISALNGKAYERGQPIDTKGKYAPSIQVLKRMWASHRLVYQDEYKPIPVADEGAIFVAEGQKAEIPVDPEPVDLTDGSKPEAEPLVDIEEKVTADASGSESDAQIDPADAASSETDAAGNAETATDSTASEAKAKPKAKSKKSGKKKAG